MCRQRKKVSTTVRPSGSTVSHTHEIVASVGVNRKWLREACPPETAHRMSLNGIEKTEKAKLS
jgi:hypothetical protein